MDTGTEDSVLDNQDLARHVDNAQFKLALIGPLIYGNHDCISQAAYIRHVVEVTKQWPDGTPFTTKPSTVKKWYYQYRAEGFKALLKEDRADKGSTRKLSESAQQEIKRLKKEHPKLNATEIYKYLSDNGYTTAGLRTVQRYAKKITVSADSQSYQKERRPFQFTQFGQAWQCDTQHVGFITINGAATKIYCMQIIDDCTRMIVGGGIVLHDNAANFQLLLKEAICNFGIPNMLMCDNGAGYNNVQLKLICGELGIILANGKPYDPQYKGKVERLNKMFQEEVIDWLDTSKIHSLEDAIEIYKRFVDIYNHRLHGATQKIPYEHYLSMKDCARVPESRTWLDRCFLNRVTRKVRNDNTVQIDKVYYDVPYGYAGQVVEIRFRVGDMSDAFMFRNGEEYPINRTNKEAYAMARFNFANNAAISPGAASESAGEHAEGTDGIDANASKRDAESDVAAQMSPYALMADDAAKKSDNG